MRDRWGNRLKSGSRNKEPKCYLDCAADSNAFQNTLDSAVQQVPCLHIGEAALVGHGCVFGLVRVSDPAPLRIDAMFVLERAFQD